MLETFGYISSIVVLISFLMKDVIRLRMVSILGCVLFSIYGYLHGTTPVVLTNIAIILINIYYIVQSKKQK